ncbi:DUF2663 family protein [Paenibacillus spongiae]|uniref:DUF2663 family protein n=1 Tax=Paenibacillus spongiae TaxID=2909671 RepID=A0ABY5S2B5_9BACL|nr:DUF2663 family protein [Paenibacillus spongiae]UVI28007.1 DUF2663 family protein [Paenibacillus spongiae]
MISVREVMDRIEMLPIAEDTKLLVKEIVDRKQKVDHIRWMNRILAVVNLGIAGVVMYWMYRLSLISSQDIFISFQYLGKSRASLLFIVVALSVFIYSGMLTKEYKKQKQKYDELRKETIDRLRAKWDITEESKLRDEISRLLDKRDINIRFLS